MTEILLIRHGETEWNAQKRLQGHLDIELNATGLRQAEALAQALRDEELEAVFCSDLRRAHGTAEPLAAMRGLTLQIEPQLRERCYGAFEGLHYTEIGACYPEGYAAMQRRDMDMRFPSGVNRAETLREFSARSVAAIEHLVRAGFRKIAVVTHGGVLDCVNRAARGLDFSKPRDVEIANAAINRLWWNGASMQIRQWGDVAHLTSQALDELG